MELPFMLDDDLVVINNYYWRSMMQLLMNIKNFLRLRAIGTPLLRFLDPPLVTMVVLW